MSHALACLCLQVVFADEARLRTKLKQMSCGHDHGRAGGDDDEDGDNDDEDVPGVAVGWARQYPPILHVSYESPMC